MIAYQTSIDLFKQISFLTALLGGFSITFLIGLLQLQDRKKQKLLNACVILSSLASFSLIISTLTSISGAYWLTERTNLSDTDSNTNLIASVPELQSALAWSSMSLLFGLNLLLISVGLAGFLRTKKVGRLSLFLSFITIAMIWYFWIFVVDVN